MPRCEKCGGSLSRAHRSFMEKFKHSAVYQCKDCGLRTGSAHGFTLHFGSICRCPHCGTERVRLRTKVDKIDKLPKTPMSLIQRMLGGSLYHCVFCRLQFYDLRKLGSTEPAAGSSAKASD